MSAKPLPPLPLRKRFGQHFLHDQSVILDILAAVAVKAEDFLIEIGPGGGALTEPLLKQLKHLTVIELDFDLIAYWQSRGIKNLTVIGADVLQVNLADFYRTEPPSARLPSARLRLVGNLPYNISTPLLLHLDAQSAYIDDMHFMLQKEVVDRLVAAPGSKTYGRLSVALQVDWEMESLFTVPPSAFTPPPAVDSAVLRLKKRRVSLCPNVNKKMLAKVVAAAFGQRRKTLGNALQTLFSAQDSAAVGKLGIRLHDRAENLAPEQFCQLAQLLATTPTPSEKRL
jgi:16S rRNA (adenine1518-N6/adenine1519-N6)-dimethyltransferase